MSVVDQPAEATTTTFTKIAIIPADVAGQQGAADGPQASAASVARLKGLDLTRFRCLRNAAYHEDRERHFVRLHKAMMFIVVLSGTTTFGAVMQSASGNIALAAAMITTVAGVIDLVFELDTKARLHATLRGRMFDILARCETATDSRA